MSKIKFNTFPKKKPPLVKKADELAKLHERNELLREKNIDPSFLKNFFKK